MKPTSLRRAFWVESFLATVAAFLAALTVVWPDWIELISVVDPDHHSGSFEWLIAVGLGVAAVMLVTVARREGRRVASATV